MKKDEKKTSNKNFFDALVNAINGIWYTIKTQRNIKIQIFVTLVVIVAGIYFKLTRVEFMLLSFACGLVLVTEMVNTAIESAVNLSTSEFHPIAKIAKDVGAGSVLVASLNAVIVGCFLFFEKIF